MRLSTILDETKPQLVKYLWESAPQLHHILKRAERLSEAREETFQYLNDLERHYYNIYSDLRYKNEHILVKNNAKECIRILKNIIRTENEKIAHFAPLYALYQIAHRGSEWVQKVNEGFLVEMIFLLRGAHSLVNFQHSTFVLIEDDHVRASQIRSAKLDDYAQNINDRLNRYRWGTDQELVEQHLQNRQKILKYFGGSRSDWYDYKWHFKHTIRSHATLQALVKLEPDEEEGLRVAEKYGLPFEITPYYLSLFNAEGRTFTDRAVRAQVLPSREYCENVIANRMKNIDMDFMGEKSTCPIEGITRRYPQIVILKPINVCPQICVYCQRNWELEPSTQAHIARPVIRKAIDWIRNNPYISEVLITGGDPLFLDDTYLAELLESLASIPHIERIRIGTRTLVTVPFRITDQLLALLSRYHVLGRREVCIVTHFEHVAEITPEAIEAVKKLKSCGISIYNQQVFTYYNSFRFESGALRKALKLSGIDPYYTFNTKGKAETIDFRIPIARIEQERKEEARFLPGLVRTDEPVFNIPRLGKSHLRAWQDHEIISILGSGARVFRFLPWESRVTLVPDYIYTDVPIYDYLKRLQKDGENVDDYGSIWYYF